jgi:hypothetical protein
MFRVRASLSLSLGMALLLACSSGGSTSSSGGASSGGGSSSGSSSGGETESKPSPTGALAFSFIGDGNTDCGGGRAPAKRCATSTPVVYGATATVRVEKGTRALNDTDTLEVEWVRGTSASGAASVAYEPSWYCDNGSFVYRKVAKKADCTGGTAFFEHFVRVKMAPPSGAIGDDYGRGFLRIKVAGEVVDEHALTFARPAELRATLDPVKQRYSQIDIVSIAPTFTQLGASTPMYAEDGAVTCEIAPDSLDAALGTALQTQFGVKPGGIEVQLRRSNVVVKYQCTALSGLGFERPLAGNFTVAP